MLTDLFEYPFLIRILNKIFNDQDKIKIINLNKFFNNIKTKFTYDTQLEINKEDQQKWYYNCLINVLIDVDAFKLPDSTKKVKFSRIFNQSIDNIIPNSVERLTFGFAFNQEIKNNLPKN